MNEKSVDIAVFLDRDGTVILDKDYLDNPDLVEFFPNAIESIKELNDRGVKIIIVSNQSGVAHGYFSEDTVDSINKKISEILAEKGAWVDANYYCPHHMEGKIEKYRMDCDCRKPKTGLAKKAEKNFGIDLKKSFVIGDKASDIEFARNIGACAMLVRTGKGKTTEKELSNDHRHKVFDTLSEAIDYIINSIEKR